MNSELSQQTRGVRNRTRGPKTERGKSVSSRNALKHGLLSNDIAIQGEDPKDFDKLRKNLEEDLLPNGELEGQLVERIAACVWRLQRICRIEANVFSQNFEEISIKRASLVSIDMTSCMTSPENDLGLAFFQAQMTIGHLGRYEVMLDRSLYKAHHELQRLQAERAGEAVPPPVVVDVAVDAASIN